MPHWEHFPHGADIGVRGIGATREEAFAEAALALTGVLTDPETVRCVEAISVNCEAPDDELLLLEWLNSLVYEMATRKMLFRDFKVSINGNRLDAEVCGEPLDVERHEPAVEVKGATCTELSVSQAEDGAWHAQCVVDV